MGSAKTVKYNKVILITTIKTTIISLKINNNSNVSKKPIKVTLRVLGKIRIIIAKINGARKKQVI